MLYLYIVALAATFFGYAVPIINIIAPFMFYKALKGDISNLRNNPFFFSTFIFALWLLSVTLYYNNLLGLLAGTFAILPTVLLFFYTGEVLDKEKSAKFLQFLVYLSMITAPVAFYQQYVLKVSISERAYATFGNANFYASYLLLIIPSAIALALKLQKKATKALLTVIALINIYCLLLTNSRSSIVALIIGCLIFALLAKNYRLLLLTFATALVLILSIYIHPELIPRYGIISSEFEERLSIWSLGWYAVTQHPLIGTGLTSFYTQYVMNYPGRYAPHAHNLYLNIWIEGGLVGLSLLLWNIKKVYHTAYDKLSQNKNILVIGVLSGLTAALLQSFMDNPLENFQTGTLFGLFIAILLRL